MRLQQLFQQRAAVITQYYRALSPMHQMLVRSAALLLLATLAYGLLHSTFNFKQQAQSQLEWEHSTLAQMQSHADRIRQLNAARQAKTGNDTSLLALVSKTAGEHKLTLQRYEPSADGKLAVWLSNVDFNTLLGWVDQLAHQYNVSIDRASIAASSTPGQVEAQLQFRE